MYDKILQKAVGSMDRPTTSSLLLMKNNEKQITNNE